MLDLVKVCAKLQVPTGVCQVGDEYDKLLDRVYVIV